jgi:hypothetical protein
MRKNSHSWNTLTVVSTLTVRTMNAGSKLTVQPSLWDTHNSSQMKQVKIEKNSIHFRTQVSCTNTLIEWTGRLHDDAEQAYTIFSQSEITWIQNHHTKEGTTYNSTANDIIFFHIIYYFDLSAPVLLSVTVQHENVLLLSVLKFYIPPC